MPLDDDDDQKWIYRDHTAAKHEVLSKYLTPWINKLTAYNERAGQYNKIRIVDCFAGRGSYVRTDGTEPYDLQHIKSDVGIPGSPLIILDRLTDRSKEFDEAECVFIEYTKDNYDLLIDNLQNASNIAGNISTSAINGPFQDSILDVVRTDGSDCPTFFFIDPFGFKSLDYDVISEIGSTDQFEFLITFMHRDINRFFEVEYHEDAVRTVFGSDDFREEVEKYDPDNWEALVEYYTDRLEDKGPEHTFEYLITEPETTQTVYYLVFGTNSQHGLHTMREVMSHCGTGGFAYAPKNPEYDRNQQTLGFGGGATKEFLTDRFAGYRVEFGDLVESCSEERPYQTETESDYRRALHELENEGRIEVVRLSSSSTGIGRGDLLDFPANE